MSNERNNHSDDSLDRATEALRGTVVPSDPSPRLIAATVAKIQGGRVQQTRSRRWRLVPMGTLSRIAAGMLIAGALMGIALYLASPWGSSAAFADVLKQVGAFRSAQFKTTITITAPDEPVQTLVGETIIAEPTRMRTTMQGGPGIAMIYVIDLQAHKMLHLYPDQKRAELTEMSSFPAEKVPPNILQELRRLRDSDGTSAGTKVIGGRPTKGFKVIKGGQEMNLWIDTDTSLPVEIDLHGQAGASPRVSATMTDFRWGQAADESLFSLKPPDGYQVESRHVDMTTNRVTDREKDLVNALKSLAELNGGVYPDGFDRPSLMKALEKSRERLLAKGELDTASPAWKQLEARQVQSMVTITRGFVFVADAKCGDDWHYAGMDVRAGSAGVPIFWYHPTSSATYRVIDADLNVHDAAPSELPTVPSARLRDSATMPATQPR